MTIEEMRIKTMRLMAALHKDNDKFLIKNISIGEKAILRLLQDKGKEGLYSGDISKYLNVGTGRIGNALKSLEKKGFIQRKKDKGDKRKVKVYLTKEGEERLASLQKRVDDAFKKVIEAYGIKRYESFLIESEDLLKVVQNLCSKEEKTC